MGHSLELFIYNPIFKSSIDEFFPINISITQCQHLDSTTYTKGDMDPQNFFEIKWAIAYNFFIYNPIFKTSIDEFFPINISITQCQHLDSTTHTKGDMDPPKNFEIKWAIAYNFFIYSPIFKSSIGKFFRMKKYLRPVRLITQKTAKDG